MHKGAVKVRQWEQQKNKKERAWEKLGLWKKDLDTKKEHV